MEAPKPSLAGTFAVAAFGVLSLLGGWLVVWNGGFSHMPARQPEAAAFVGGLPALFMAFLQFLAAALALTWVLRQGARTGLSPMLAGWIAFGLVFVPPVGFLIAG